MKSWTNLYNCTRQDDLELFANTVRGFGPFRAEKRTPSRHGELAMSVQDEWGGPVAAVSTVSCVGCLMQASIGERVAADGHSDVRATGGDDSGGKRQAVITTAERQKPSELAAPAHAQPYRKNIGARRLGATHRHKLWPPQLPRASLRAAFHRRFRRYCCHRLSLRRSHDHRREG